MHITGDSLVTAAVCLFSFENSPIRKSLSERERENHEFTMNAAKTETGTLMPRVRSCSRNIFNKVLGGWWGLSWMSVFTAAATLLRWIADGLLNDTAPFTFYFLSVVLTALVARLGSAILAVIVGGLCAHFFWVEPRCSFQFSNTSQIAQLVVYVFVATSCACAVSAARVLRIYDYLVTEDD